MSIFKSFIYGLLSGITEFLPISSGGHQALFRLFFDITQPTPILDLMIHIAFLAAIVMCCTAYIKRLRRTSSSTSASNRRPRNYLDKVFVYDSRLIRTSSIISVLLVILFQVLNVFTSSLSSLALFFAINGVIIYVPQHFAYGDKDSGKLSLVDSIILGILTGLSMLPGISRIGVGLSYSIWRGADKDKIFNWIMMISIPYTVVSILIDVISLFSSGIGLISFSILIGYLLAAIAAFCAAVLTIKFMRQIVSQVRFPILGFYCWGVSLLTFILFMTA